MAIGFRTSKTKRYIQCINSRLINNTYLFLFLLNAKMKRAECYGHIVLSGACVVRKKNDSDCAFIIAHTDKSAVFSTKGPFGLIASSSHRVYVI